MTKLELTVYEDYLNIVLKAETDEAALTAIQVLIGLMDVITLRKESGVKMPKESLI